MNQTGLKPISMLWIGNPLSRTERMCMKSFMANGHELHLYTAAPVGNVPEGVIIRDLREITKTEPFKHENSYAAYADLFRWHLMKKHGGWYVDTDVCCLKPFVPTADIVIGREDTNGITPTVLYFDKSNHPVAQEMAYAADNPLVPRYYDSDALKRFKQRFKMPWRLEFWKKVGSNDKELPHAFGWGETAGPAALTRYYEHEGKKYFRAQPEAVFYPVHYSQWKELFLPGCLTIEGFEKQTLGMHFWNEMWRRDGIDKNAPYPKGSLLAELEERYGS